jgi:hypothetical protein
MVGRPTRTSDRPRDREAECQQWIRRRTTAQGLTQSVCIVLVRRRSNGYRFAREP